MKIKECKICGNTFETSGSRITCSPECAKANQRNLAKESNRKRSGIPVKKFKRNTAVKDMAAEARKHGMTYGQYVGMMYERSGNGEINEQRQRDTNIS